MQYDPAPCGATDAEGVARWAEGEFLKIAQSLSETTALDLRPIHAPPRRAREGMLVFADGTDWNPGGGKGVYQYSGGAWVKL